MLWWVVSLVSASLLAGLALLLWLRRPPAPLWPVVFACQISALCWVVGDLWATHATSLLEKQLALTLLFTGAVSVATLWWTTARLYVAAHGLGRPWMGRRSVRFGPAVFVGAAWLFAATNPWHGQLMTPVVGGPNEHHWGAWLLAHVNYAVVVATFVLCVWATWRHTSSDVSRRMAILAVATLAPLATNLVHVYLRLGARTDEVAIGLGVGSVAILYGIYRQRLFNPLPLALHEVLDRDPVGVLLLGSRGRLLYWNPAAARMLEGMGLELDMELVPALAGRLVGMDATPPPLWRALSRMGAEQEPRVYRYQGEGEARWLRLSVAPLSTRRKRLAALCLRLEDVTELQRVERQRRQLARRIRQLEKLESLGVMAGGVAHDFNNLLTAIGGFADLTLAQLDDESLRENLRMIVEATDLAADLTHELLSYAGRSHMTKGPVVLSELVAATSALLRGSLPKAVEVQADLPSGLPPVHGDPTQLRQVVMNLLTNAGQALGEGGGALRIRTCTRDLDRTELSSEGLDGILEPGAYVGIEVSDSGCGIGAEALPQIFEPFFSTRDGGRGIGLAVVFGIVRAHGGGISVCSDEGRGTRFRVWLPVSSEDQSPEVTQEEPKVSVATRWRGSGTLLVVDDQQPIRQLARRVLEEAGFEVLTASSGPEAVALHREHAGRIRLVLLDLTMPGMAGDEVLRKIREIDPDVRVLLSSGYDETDAMSRIPSEKVWGFVAKPYHPAELLHRIRRALSTTGT